MEKIQITADAIKQALAARQRRVIIDPGRVPAAVLLPLYCEDGQYKILFTKRTARVRDHAGEISFPGGVRHKHDVSLLKTALRESCEEIGLAPSDVQVLGALDDTPTRTTNYLVSPFLGLIPSPYQFKLCAAEVDRLITISIDALRTEARFTEKPSADPRIPTPEYSYFHNGDVIWGATASILKQFLDIVGAL